MHRFTRGELISEISSLAEQIENFRDRLLTPELRVLGPDFANRAERMSVDQLNAILVGLEILLLEVDEAERLLKPKRAKPKS